MKKETFWREASRCGAILGGVTVLFQLLTMWLQGSVAGSIVSLTSTVVTVWLLYHFTKCRSVIYGAEEGYTYGNGLKFICCMAIFAGIVSGAYEIVARNWLFPDTYREMMNLALGTLAQSKLYATAQLTELKELYQTIMFSPIWIVVSMIIGSIFSCGFFGLFIAAFTKREPNLFEEKSEE